MNLGQYVSDLIRVSNEMQKISAGARDLDRIYHLALEIKDTATQIQSWAIKEMKEKA